jgi:predicted NAD/FAD-binding protein
MRIGIVGGGAAGLICAWLLEAEHEVTLFEADPVLGGHAKSHSFMLDGVSRNVDPGFHFVSQNLQPVFVRLLNSLRVPTTPYGMTCTFYDADSPRTMALPPVGNLSRIATMFRPDTLVTLLRFNGLLNHAGRLKLDSDADRTLESLLAPLGFPESFTREFLYPFLASNWGVPDAEVRGFSAPNALLYAHRNRGLNPRWLEVNGGMGEYVRALSAACARTTLHVGRTIKNVRGGAIADDAGNTSAFDHIIVAGSAESARGLLDGSATEPARRALSGLEYFDTKIAIHGDASVMPRNRALWSVVNLRREGPACAIHHWAGWRTGVPVFRSWVTHAARPVSPVYAEFSYRHPRPTPAYFAAQRALAEVQGHGGLWFAGMHTTGYDNHESAVQSAVRIARNLAPDSANLRALDAASA